MITHKQKTFLNKLKEIYDKEPLPSFEKICKDMGYKSKNSIWQYFRKLIEHGYIKECGKRFFLSNDLYGISYCEPEGKACVLSIDDECSCSKLSFDSFLVKKPVSTCCIRVIGDSMADAGIYEDDIAIIDKDQQPKDNDMVMAIVNGEFILKYCKIKKKQITLESANKASAAIKLSPKTGIFGVVIGVVRKLENQSFKEL